MFLKKKRALRFFKSKRSCSFCWFNMIILQLAYPSRLFLMIEEFVFVAADAAVLAEALLVAGGAVAVDLVVLSAVVHCVAQDAE